MTALGNAIWLDPYPKQASRTTNVRHPVDSLSVPSLWKVTKNLLNTAYSSSRDHDIVEPDAAGHTSCRNVILQPEIVEF